MKEIIRRCVKMNTVWFTMRKNARLVNFNVVLHPTNNAVLHPVNNVVLHHVNNVVLHPLIQQCCRQGRSAMITMLLQHCSTINMFQLVNKVSTLYYRESKLVRSCYPVLWATPDNKSEQVCSINNIVFSSSNSNEQPSFLHQCWTTLLKQ